MAASPIHRLLAQIRHLAIMLILLGVSPALAAQGSVAVIYPKAEEPAYRLVFQATLKAIQDRLHSNRVATPTLAITGSNPGQLKGWLAGHPTEVIITLGRQAFEDYQTLKAPRPAVSGLLDLSPNLNPTAYGIGLSVDPVLFFETLKKTTPKVRRVFVVYNPAKDQWLVALAKHAAPHFSLELVPFEAADLVSATRAYGQILEQITPDHDAIWLPLDSKLLDESAVLPLILEQSWYRRFVVFSNSLLHAELGALFAIYPDNEALGRRLADKALTLLHRSVRPDPEVEPLRTVRRAINKRFAEHLGVEVTGALQTYFDLIIPSFNAD
jgi:putative tryptophan/tyrosine transport system substrate-binding protein